MGIPTKQVIGRYGTGRCKNCRCKFPRNRKNQKFHNWKCKSDWHHNGGTPTVNVLARVRKFCKTEEFKKIVRNQVKRELNALRRPVESLPALSAPVPDRS